MGGGKPKWTLKGLEPFGRYFPEQSAAETRVAIVLRHDVLPEDDYGLVVSYCVDPGCDCRRVMLNVFGRRQAARGILATVGFGFRS